MVEAARALGAPAATLSTWTRGCTRRRSGRTDTIGDSMLTALEAPPGEPSIPFVGLAEGMLLAAVRRVGIPLKRVRPALEFLAQEIGVSHVFASKKLYTDGAEILFEYSSSAPADEAEAIDGLVVVQRRRHVFKGVLLDNLNRITYAEDGFASVIKLPAFEYAEVIADPHRAFGQPIFALGATRVNDVLERFWSGEDIDSLVREFGVPKSDIEDVLRTTSRQVA